MISKKRKKENKRRSGHCLISLTGCYSGPLHNYTKFVGFHYGVRAIFTPPPKLPQVTLLSTHSLGMRLHDSTKQTFIVRSIQGNIHSVLILRLYKNWRMASGKRYRTSYLIQYACLLFRVCYRPNSYVAITLKLMQTEHKYDSVQVFYASANCFLKLVL